MQSLSCDDAVFIRENRRRPTGDDQSQRKSILIPQPDKSIEPRISRHFQINISI